MPKHGHSVKGGWPSSIQERLVFRAVLGLVITVVFCITAIIILSTIDRLRPEALAVLGGVATTSVGALATTLTSFAPPALPGGRRVTDPPEGHTGPGEHMSP